MTLETPHIIPRPTPEVFVTSSLSNELPQRRPEYAYRDERFFEEELTLDASIEQGTPDKAIPMEKSLLEEVREATHVPEGLVRITLKAVALGQIARQFDPSRLEPSEDPTYKNLAMLLDKTVEERRRLIHQNTPEAIDEARYVTGILSETAFYALSTYDIPMTRPLTGRSQGAQPRYILPSTISADFGDPHLRGGRHSLHKRGFDYTVTYAEGDDPYRYIQVKSSEQKHHHEEYHPSIIIVPMNTLLSTTKRVNTPTALPFSIISDAKGNQGNGTYRHINAASRRLNKLIA